MALIANDINKSYGSQKVLDGLSLILEKGEIVGLLGRNGVGKSTLLKILAGINLPDNGEVNRQNQKIGFLSERNPIYPFMYVREYLEWVGKMTQTRQLPVRIDWCIKEVGLNDVVGKKVVQLSKGYKQRLGLAATLLPDPDVLMLDEPISGLDPIQIEEYRALIKRLAADKVIILSSHLLSEIESLCDRVLLLKEGRISEDHKMTKSQGKTLKLVLSAPIDESKLTSIAGVEKVKVVGSEHYLVLCSAGEDIRTRVFDEVVAADSKILEMAYEKSSLNELFL